MKSSTCRLGRWWGPAVVAALVGCAPEYHWYQGCVAPYGYCAPRPLPFERYQPPPCPVYGPQYEPASWVPRPQADQEARPEENGSQPGYPAGQGESPP